MRVLNTSAESEVRKRQDTDRSALEPDQQTASFAIGHKSRDGPTGEIDLPFRFPGLEVEEEHRIPAMCHQAARTVKKDDRIHVATGHEFLDGAACGKIPKDDVPRQVARRQPPAGWIKSQRVDNLGHGELALRLTRVRVPDDDLVRAGKSPAGYRQEGAVRTVYQGSNLPGIGSNRDRGGAGNGEVPRTQLGVAGCREIFQTRVGCDALEFDSVADQPLLHVVPAGDLVEEDFSGVVQVHREKIARWRPLNSKRRAETTRKCRNALPSPCLPDPGGVVEAPRGDPLAVRTEGHVENPFAVTPKPAELLALRHVPEDRGVVEERGG